MQGRTLCSGIAYTACVRRTLGFSPLVNLMSRIISIAEALRMVSKHLGLILYTTVSRRLSVLLSESGISYVLRISTAKKFCAGIE